MSPTIMYFEIALFLKIHHENLNVYVITIKNNKIISIKNHKKMTSYRTIYLTAIE